MDVHSDHSEDESTAPGSSNGDSVYLTPSVSGMEIGSVRKSLLMLNTIEMVVSSAQIYQTMNMENFDKTINLHNPLLKLLNPTRSNLKWYWRNRPI